MRGEFIRVGPHSPGEMIAHLLPRLADRVLPRQVESLVLVFGLRRGGVDIQRPSRSNQNVLQQPTHSNLLSIPLSRLLIPIAIPQGSRTGFRLRVGGCARTGFFGSIWSGFTLKIARTAAVKRAAAPGASVDETGAGGICFTSKLHIAARTKPEIVPRRDGSAILGNCPPVWLQTRYTLGSGRRTPTSISWVHP